MYKPCIFVSDGVKAGIKPEKTRGTGDYLKKILHHRLYYFNAQTQCLNYSVKSTYTRFDKSFFNT